MVLLLLLKMDVIAAHLRAAYPTTRPSQHHTTTGTDSNAPQVRALQDKQTHHPAHTASDTLHPATTASDTVALHAPMDVNASQPTPHPSDLGKTFTPRELKKRDDWEAWRKARYKMLDSYREQGMFSAPMEAPQQANIHHMLWRCVCKMCGTRKACMVCDGSPRQGTITLGYTFANSLDSDSERMFWAVVAHKGLIAYGADVFNAFAEAPPPMHPLYLRIDEAFCGWWQSHLQNPPIPPHHMVVHVNNAIQGHPEPPRLWEKLIDKILRDIGLKPTTHEPCLYQGIINESYTLFLWQVDDFALATTTEQQANAIIMQINQHLCLPIHNLGKIDKFNSVDIDQTKYYVKIDCTKYLTKLAQTHHGWISNITLGDQPIPFPSDAKSLTKLLQCPTPTTQEEKYNLEKYMGIKYRHIMGEVLYPMIKCRPDVSTHTILLSQYIENPDEAHYLALKRLVAYLVHT
jgi:hypothetical protein